MTVLRYNEADGSFEEIQKVPTLPEDFTDFNSGAAVRVSKDGRFVYSSNRGHNSLVVFEVTEDGAGLNFIQRRSTEGDFPRDF